MSNVGHPCRKRPASLLPSSHASPHVTMSCKALWRRPCIRISLVRPVLCIRSACMRSRCYTAANLQSELLPPQSISENRYDHQPLFIPFDQTLMSSFGFNTALPERPSADGGGQQSTFGGFAGSGGNNDTTAFSMGGAGEEEDLAVYNWGDQMGSLMEGGDGMNDETFGNVGEIGEYTGSSQ